MFRLAGDWNKPLVSILATKWKISWIISQEQMVAKLQDRFQLFKAVWEPWTLYIKVPLCPGFVPP